MNIPRKLYEINNIEPVQKPILSKHGYVIRMAADSETAKERTDWQQTCVTESHCLYILYV